MIRRTLVLFGAAVLMSAGLAGPANASASDNVEFAQVQTGTSSDPTDAFVEYETIDSDPYSLQNHSLEGCAGLNSSTVIVFKAAYGNVSVPGTGVWRTADPGFLGSSDDTWDMGASGALDDPDHYHLFLIDSGGTPVAEASNGTTNCSP